MKDIKLKKEMSWEKAIHFYFSPLYQQNRKLLQKHNGRLSPLSSGMLCEHF